MSRYSLSALAIPIVQAPMAGGPSTPELTVAVSAAGALGFLAAGYRPVEAMRSDIADVRARTAAPFGVNIFAPPGHGTGDVDAYRRRLAATATRYGVSLGEARWDDDRYAEKLTALADDPVPIVSFTFGCPAPGEVQRLRDVGTAVWVTVTTATEARQAIDAGADGLVVQGVEAGGHRGGFDDTVPGDLGILALLQLVRREHSAAALVAAGGIATGGAVAAVLACGADAAALGTAFMRCPEAGTSEVHRDALARPAPTALTRAFTGRTARGIVNGFLTEHDAAAPSAYPEVHHLTAPLRAAARQSGDPEAVNLWAGQTHELARDLPAGELVARTWAEARDAARRIGRRLDVTW